MTGEENIGSVAHLSPLEQVVLISQMESERQVLLAHLHVSPNATVEELITVEGINNQLAEKIYNYFN